MAQQHSEHLIVCLFVRFSVLYPENEISQNILLKLILNSTRTESQTTFIVAEFVWIQTQQQ